MIARSCFDKIINKPINPEITTIIKASEIKPIQPSKTIKCFNKYPIIVEIKTNKAGLNTSGKKVYHFKPKHFAP